MADGIADGGRLGDGAADEDERVLGAPGLSIGGSQRPRGGGVHRGHVEGLADLERRLEVGDGAGMVAPAEVQEPRPQMGEDLAVRMLDGLGEPDGVLAHSGRRGEVAQLGERPGQHRRRVHGGQERHAEALAREIALESLQIAAREIGGGAVLGHRVVGEGEEGIGGRLHRDVANASADRDRAPPVFRGQRQLQRHRVEIGQEGGDQAEASRIVGAVGERLGLLEVVEHAPEVAQRRERVAQVEAEIDGQDAGLGGLGEMLERPQGLLEVLDGGAVGGAREGAPPCLAPIPHRLLPQLGPARMMREALDTLVARLRPPALQRRDEAGVELVAALAQQPAIGHLERQRVREGVLGLGEQPQLVEELARLEPAEAVPQLVLAQLGGGGEEIVGDVFADGRATLEQPLVRRAQPVDARAHQRLHGGGDLDGGHRPRQMVVAGCALEGAGLRQVPHALLEVERIALGALDQPRRQRGQVGI